MYKIKFITSFLFWWSLLLASCCTLLFVCFFSWYLSEIRPDAHVCPICCLIMDESKTEVLLATLLYPPFFLLICKAACCKFVLKVSKIGGGALPGFTCGTTVTPQLVQLCVFCSYVVAWYVWKIDFCIYFVFGLRSLSVYVRAEHQELLLCFFLRCSAFSQLLLPLLVLRLFGYFILWNITCFFVGLIHSPCS